MKKRTLFLAALTGFIVLATLDRAVAFRSSATALAEVNDLAGITSISIAGEASHISLATAPGQPFTASLSERRDGWGAVWRSAWSQGSCASGASLRRDGNELIVDTGHRPAMDWSDCTLELTANLPPEVSVLVRQKAARIDMAGDFDQADIDAAAGDVSFTGHARELALSGAAMRAKAVYSSVRNDETIRLSGRMMDATLRFLTPTPVSYAVEATASFIDSRLPNVPGAKPAISIKGDMVRARIE
ncbi:hypothetical protein [Allorhizobium undicola]|uniref:hypothetical protein n=1 Tax=Allorhizobium undicola TaxID=78527 RepID=UPI00048479AC|nr:hypothetical protein [Allorhizobium undicola]